MYYQPRMTLNPSKKYEASSAGSPLISYREMTARISKICTTDVQAMKPSNLRLFLSSPRKDNVLLVIKINKTNELIMDRYDVTPINLRRNVWFSQPRKYLKKGPRNALTNSLRGNWSCQFTWNCRLGGCQKRKTPLYINPWETSCANLSLDAP